jgi:hypothetical protein
LRLTRERSAVLACYGMQFQTGGTEMPAQCADGKDAFLN